MVVEAADVDYEVENEVQNTGSRWGAVDVQYEVGDEVQYKDGNLAVVTEVHRDDGVPWYYTICFHNGKPDKQTVARKLAMWIPKIN